MVRSLESLFQQAESLTKRLEIVEEELVAKKLAARLAEVEAELAAIRPPRPNPRPMRERTYTVQVGDTLAKVSKALTGQAGNYVELATFNRIPATTILEPGTTLRIPLTWPLR